MSSGLTQITLHYPPGFGGPAGMAGERDRAIADLVRDSVFQPLNDNNGPYRLDISLEQQRLVLQIKNRDDADLPMLILSMRPYRAIIRDYFLMIESYEQMRIAGTPHKLEPIDMARRGLHNEAAEMVRERLSDKITLDHATARRLFTLICALSA